MENKKLSVTMDEVWKVIESDVINRYYDLDNNTKSKLCKTVYSKLNDNEKRNFNNFAMESFFSLQPEDICMEEFTAISNLLNNDCDNFMLYVIDESNGLYLDDFGINEKETFFDRVVKLYAEKNAKEFLDMFEVYTKVV